MKDMPLDIATPEQIQEALERTRWFTQEEYPEVIHLGGPISKIGKRIRRSCIVCGEIYYIRPCDTYKRKYCSIECKHKNSENSRSHLHPKVLWKCQACGKEELKTPTEAKAKKYCSFQCFKSIPRKRKPRSEKRSFRISPEWRHARKKCISKFGHVCPVSFKREPIEVHHIDFDWSNNEPENLIPLWAPLHRLITARAEVSQFYEALDRNILSSIIKAWKQ